MIIRIFILMGFLFISGCAEFADVLGAGPQSSAYSQNAVRAPETSSRIDNRVDMRVSSGPGPATQEISGATEEESESEVPSVGVTDASGAVTFIWPVAGGVLTSRFGIRRGRSHDGIDISARRGTPIKAASDGKVVYAGRMSGYGNLIVVKHAGNFFTAYAHAEKNKVSKGDKVKKGEVIATVGRSGRASGPHCHFEIREKTVARNPLYFLPKTDTYAAGK